MRRHFEQWSARRNKRMGRLRGRGTYLPGSFRHQPNGVKGGRLSWRPLGEIDLVFTLVRCGDPLIVAGRRHEASPPLEGLSKHRLGSDGFRPRVERRAAHFLKRLLPPARNQSPPYRQQDTFVITPDHNIDGVGRTTAPYRSERNESWIKTKCLQIARYEVIGYKQGATSAGAKGRTCCTSARQARALLTP
jgi:hypothetical protein